MHDAWQSPTVGGGASALEDELVTVVIPARNEEQFISRCLQSVSAQTYRRMEILVVDGASTDGTAQVVRAYARRDRRVRLLHNERATVPFSLNIGAQEAAGRWFVRIDAHATVAPDYVARCVTHLRTGRWGGVGGRVDPIGVTPAGRAIGAAMCSRFGIGNSVHHYGSEPVAADHVPFPGYPVALIRELGGWDEQLTVNQDFEFDYRMVRHGHRILYDPDLVISYHGQQSIRGVLRQFRRYGRGKSRVVRLHPGSARVRHLVPPSLVAVLAAAIVVAPRRPRLAAAAVLPYLGAVGVASVTAVRHVEGRRAKATLPLAFLAMHLGWGFGFLEGTVGAGFERAQRRPLRRRSTTASPASAPTATAAHVTAGGDERCAGLPAGAGAACLP